MHAAKPEFQLWLTAARDGCRDALGKALESCRRYLLCVARHELDLSLQAKGGASDLVQETFLEAHRDFDRFRGDSEVELLAPRDSDGPIARFLARRGPGIHHICYRVPDLDAALAACRRAGYRLIDESPRTGAGGRRIAFVHPKATAGILLELTE